MGYGLVWEASGVILRFNGCVSFGEILSAVTEMHSDGRFVKLRYLIADWLDARERIVNETQMDWLARFEWSSSQKPRNLRRAVVAAAPLLAQIADHVSGASVNGYPTEFFTSMEDARAWIGDVMID